MKFYIAGRFVNKDEVAAFARHVRGSGHDVISTWTDERHSPTVEMSEVSDEELADTACRDLQEIIDCDRMIFFAESDTFATARNGRHVEFGIALALGKRIDVIGPRENIFHHCFNVFHYPSKVMYLTMLGSALARV